MNTEPERFGAGLVAHLDEPVRRYLTHAIGDGALIAGGTQLRMRGRIKVGVWLPFSAEEHCEARSFQWRARVGLWRIRPLEVVDGYAHGRGRTGGRLGPLKLFEQADDDTARSAAGRTALEAAVWAPTSLLGNPRVEWRAESEEEIVTSWPVPPERPEVRLRIDEEGALKTAVADRWGDAGDKRFAYIPCGCEIHAERRFGDFTVPSRVTVGWRFGTPRYAPFFKAEITGVAPAS